MAGFQVTSAFTAGSAGSAALAPVSVNITGFDVSVGVATAAGTMTITVNNLAGTTIPTYYLLESTTTPVMLSIRFPNPLMPTTSAINVAVSAVTNGGAGIITIYGVAD